MAATKYPVKADCPTCGDLMHVSRLDCDTCGTSVEGSFFLHSMNRLPTESIAFLESFIRNKGVIKDIEVDLGISYPTVKARLDEVVRQLGYPQQQGRLRPSQEREERRNILEELRTGAISAETAAERLADLNERAGS